MHLYGLNPWDYNLITVLVVDGFGEGIPVAWAVANREDATTLVELLKSIKERTGPLQPRWFMSDDANQYFNAWKGVLGAKETSMLLCVWHVDQAWRTALNQHVRTQQARNEIHYQLRILLMKIFSPAILQQFLSFVDASETAFSKYFKEKYCNRPSEWASYCRIGSANMFLESFHRTLKVVYLQHKYNRRVLHILLKISRDKVFEQLTKLEKGKYTRRVSEINKRHKRISTLEPLSENIQAICSEDCERDLYM